VPRGRRLLESVAAAGGDSVFADAVLAQLDANAGDYPRAAAEASTAIAALHPTLARPFPGALEGALTTLAREAPPAIAGPLFVRTVVARPFWQFGYWGGAVVAARVGGRACAMAVRLSRSLRQFGWSDEETAPLAGACGADRPA
jgi:hypothetical protein